MNAINHDDNSSDISDSDKLLKQTFKIIMASVKCLGDALWADSPC